MLTEMIVTFPWVIAIAYLLIDALLHFLDEAAFRYQCIAFVYLEAEGPTTEQEAEPKRWRPPIKSTVLLLVAGYWPLVPEEVYCALVGMGLVHRIAVLFLHNLGNYRFLKALAANMNDAYGPIVVPKWIALENRACRDVGAGVFSALCYAFTPSWFVLGVALAFAVSGARTWARSRRARHIAVPH